jgi:hypothetical protein
MSETTTALPEAFHPEEQEGSEFNVLPKGEYVAQVIDVKVSPHSTGDGYGINLTWQIGEGEHENRCVFQHITFQHSSAQAQQIGRQQLKDLCVATGIHEQVSDVEVFKFIPCRIRLGIKKDSDGIDQNKVSRVLPLEPPPKPEKQAKAPEPAKPAASKPMPETAKAPQAAANNGGGTPPWREPPKSTHEDRQDEVPY